MNTMEVSRRRLDVVAGHFNLLSRPSGSQGLSSSLDVLALQQLLDHDNLEMREHMKALMRQDVYIP